MGRVNARGPGDTTVEGPESALLGPARHLELVLVVASEGPNGSCFTMGYQNFPENFPHSGRGIIPKTNFHILSRRARSEAEGETNGDRAPALSSCIGSPQER